MNRHLTLRSGNPTLNAKTFSGFDVTAGATMTIMGTVHKTALGLLLLMTSALYTWNLPLGDPRTNMFMMIGIFGGFGVAILTALSTISQSSRYLHTPYCRDWRWVVFPNISKCVIQEL
jgi:uncharacterized YccA/Bax inhibitor family protein